jgi:hypothetical protein
MFLKEMVISDLKSATGIVTGWTAGVRLPKGARHFCVSHVPYRLWGPPVSHRMGTGELFLGGKVTGA